MTETYSSSFIAQLSNSLSDINHSKGSCDRNYESFYFSDPECHFFYFDGICYLMLFNPGVFLFEKHKQIPKTYKNASKKMGITPASPLIQILCSFVITIFEH